MKASSISSVSKLPSLAEMDVLLKRSRAWRKEADRLVASLERARKEVVLQEASDDCVGIQRVVASFFDKQEWIMLSDLRPVAIVWPRQVAMFFCRKFTDLTLEEIGKAFGGRDHGTVMHAIAAVEDRVSVEELAREQVLKLEGQLRQLFCKTDLAA